MKHKVKGRKFSRLRKQRKALLKTLLGSLILCEKITTTEAKAKEIKPLIDKIISKVRMAKNGQVSKMEAFRKLKELLPNKAVDKLMGEFGEKFISRKSGYSRIIKLPRRKSDGAKMAVIEII